MFKNLPHGVKISISRSIASAFEQYMNKIQWNEDKYDLNVFMQEWRSYIEKHASWYDKVEDVIKNDGQFHEELAEKINEVLDKVLSEEPSKEQMEELDLLEKELGQEFTYSCKAEAKYLIERLQKQVKKNS
ncbi:hypothetical protein ACFSCX_10620 [Bacillus salitolerans]|uniref:Group-specific protein n=1 Tax=Bacillus salitolerans TaxID=1437434 RepID=A0ABW4LQ84_9BACI